MKKEILSFEYENNKYVLLFDNEYLFKKEVNNELQDVNEEEKLLIKKVMKQTLPGNEYYDLGFYRHNDKTYKHFIDKNNFYHTFYEVKDNELKVPDEEMINYFNLKYNSAISKLYAGNLTQNNTYNRFARIGKKIVKVAITTALLVNLWPATSALASQVTYIPVIDEVSSITKDVQDEIIIEEVTEQKLSMEIVEQTINNNPNLSSQEKEFILSQKLFFEELLPYFNYESFVKNYGNLKIIYTPEEFNSIKGLYSAEDNTITMYESTNFADVDKHVLFHEIIHVGHENANIHTLAYNYIEALTEMFVSEYSNEGTQVYSIQIKNLKQLTEIVGPEVLKEFYVKADLNILINELTKIVPDPSVAVSLLVNNFEHCNAFDYDTFEKKDNEGVLQARYEYQDLIKYYYENKFGPVANNFKLYMEINRESALKDFNMAIQHNPKYAEAYYYRAAIKRDFKDEGFVDDYRKAIQLNPSLKAVNDADVLMILKI